MTQDHVRFPGDPGTGPHAAPGALPDALGKELRQLRVDSPPARDLWPGIAARLEPRTAGTPAPPGSAAGARRRDDHRRGHRRRNAGYAAAAAVVMAAGIGWQLWPGSGVVDAPVPAPRAAAPMADAGGPLLLAADALAREYQGALREVAAASRLAMPAGARAAATHDLDAELERRATEVRAALARDPDALHLLHRLQDIYAHRLALSRRQA